MGKQYLSISDKNIEFIENQKMYFVGTATQDSRVSISPKGMDSFKVLGPNRVIWLNVTGSGNETAAHVQIDKRMTIMFLAFDGSPNILRLYGQAKVIHHNDNEWDDLYSHFSPLPGARQIFDVEVDLVQNSCGMSVPLLSYEEDRNQLKEWSTKQGEESIKKYWEKKNQHSLDGLETHILEKNL
ncbi:pyridoxamine 5'-phosphate oxidase family protein [Psychromonas sp. Urea-02u-13]|uniref:pyridoxamine 5'-phosphate oxidase family protein n=1 Tax=Psychromonas sp. Urea-02u-13 TaxID=2058326 RepID=UPI000C32263C|nr:pyridoxamine 5'-phosphate oxidase family protein [Psychromonas sp. Urea-02u-13]PKG37773.1 pyridoxamine 5'-phosphate oxidase [Psychromonas sp. Urea-02u-13]